MDRQIILELYRSLVLLGADFNLLSTIGSWKDSLPNNIVLYDIKRWNETTLSELKERIEHYEISCPRSACNVDVGH
jgi:hypothetical protein